MLLSVYGDSIAAAFGLPPIKGFVPKLASSLATSTGQYTNYMNFAQDGMTSWDLAGALEDQIDWRDGLHAAQTVCILIGGDDLIHDLPILIQHASNNAVKRALATSRAAYFSLLATAVAVKNRRSRIAVGTIYNPFPNTPIAAEAINLYNEAIIVPTASRFGIPIAPVHQAFFGNEPQLIKGYSNGVAGSSGRSGIRYPIHPNAEGQSVIAGVFAAALASSPPTPK